MRTFPARLARRGGFARALLLYWPIRARAWRYRIPFYLLVFFVIPLFAFASFGAYVGQGEWLPAAPVALAFIGLALSFRGRALRADAMLPRGAATASDRRRLADDWPFPILQPPPRRPLLGLLSSLLGNVFVMVGFLGGGLAANAVVGPVFLAVGAGMDRVPDLAPGPIVALAIVAFVAGSLTAVYGTSFGIRLRDRGRRLRARDARTLRLAPGERPVLLLRSFGDEELVDPRPLNFLQRRYEERLCPVLEEIGPVLTIGRPGSDLGHSGAARFYVADEHWQRAIEYLMQHAAATVIIVGETSGLWWEITTALTRVPREQLLFFVPLIDLERRGDHSTAAWRDYVGRWNLARRRYARMESARIARYADFRSRTGEILSNALPRDLGKACFFDFTASDRIRVLQPRYGLLRHPLLDLVPRWRRARFSMRLTLRPFIDKLQGLNS